MSTATWTGERAREIGPAGTASRVVAGVIAIALPVALGGLGWWDAAAAVTLVPLATAGSWLVQLAFGGHSPRGHEGGPGICSPRTCALAAVPLAGAVALTATTPADGDVVLWGFLGLSMLLAAARGDGGCEVLAFPNAIRGRRDRIGCVLFSRIDAAEARSRPRGPSG